MLFAWLAEFDQRYFIKERLSAFRQAHGAYNNLALPCSILRHFPPSRNMFDAGLSVVGSSRTFGLSAVTTRCVRANSASATAGAIASVA